MRRAFAALVAVEAAAFGVGVLWVLFALTLLRADIDGLDPFVSVVLCVAHAAAAMVLASSGETRPRFPVYGVLVLQVPIVGWAATRGEPLFYALAALAAMVLVVGAVSILGRPAR